MSFRRPQTGTLPKQQTGTLPKVQTGAIGKRSTQETALEGPSITELKTTIFTDTFQATGTLRAPGVLQTFLNDDQRPTISLFNAELIGYEPSNPASRIVIPELIIRKPACAIVAFAEQPAEGQITLLPRAELLAVYMPHFMVEADFHMGADARINDFIDTSIQQFIFARNAAVYPLLQPRTPLVASAPIIALQKTAVRLYHSSPSANH